MISFIQKGGPFMWLILVIAIAIVVLTVKKVIDFFVKKNLNKLELESGLNAIIFWGAISALIGFLGHFMGVFYAMEAISEANDISPAIVAMGYGVSLITILSGLTVFLISSIIWFVFRWQLKVRAGLTD